MNRNTLVYVFVTTIMLMATAFFSSKAFAASPITLDFFASGLIDSTNTVELTGETSDGDDVTVSGVIDSSDNITMTIEVTGTITVDLENIAGTRNGKMIRYRSDNIRLVLYRSGALVNMVGFYEDSTTTPGPASGSTSDCTLEANAGETHEVTSGCIIQGDVDIMDIDGNELFVHDHKAETGQIVGTKAEVIVYFANAGSAQGPSTDQTLEEALEVFALNIFTGGCEDGCEDGVTIVTIEPDYEVTQNEVVSGS
jgi:hypothetical protein